MLSNLRDFIALLRKEKEIVEINCEVDPNLEAAEIHRRIIEKSGPALLFNNIKDAKFPLITNLFGTKKRVDLAFGSKPEKLVKEVAKMPEELMPPSISKLWHKRSTIIDLLKVGLKKQHSAAVSEVIDTPPALTRLPLLKTWEEDGGHFITLPLVYTEHPETHVHNLGMYRMQRYDDSTLGLHCQIGKGGGFHLEAAKLKGQKLPVNVHIGGPPGLILSAIAPLPENVPELLLASLVLGKHLKMSKTSLSPLPIVSEAEFVLVGEVDPNELRPEGPFGDHYGYYSLKHDYPVFHCKALLHRKDAICTATVVGKPRQEDFFIGDYLQELLSPLFPLVMPTVKDLWSYGETGFHSLSAAVVRQRYKREAMVSAFRILGEGQLSLTKFLLVLDQSLNLKDFKKVLSHILERCDFRTDLYVFSNLSMDTLDYTGPKVNEGSKGVLLGVGEAIRTLKNEYSGDVPRRVENIIVFCPGCLVVSGPSYEADPEFAQILAKQPYFSDWPLVILVDNAKDAAGSTMNFLWTTFTRFEPGADIFANSKNIERNHISYVPPIVIDARMKPNYPAELKCDENTSRLVDKRWHEYFG
jgi:4-hydroxybenzoate decarboxylase subunit C